MSKKQCEELSALFDKCASKLPNVERKKMFGCDAFFKKGDVFGLIWKTGRIGLKLPYEAKFDKLMGVEGSAPWKAGNKTMSKWVLVPKAYHENTRSLNKWIKEAHSLAVGKK